ncbi:MAG: acyl-CoA thioesterase [Bacteroidia bacterium]|nr:acyl-CoA thioesterase [Bacteroidota bacterium]MCZ2130258.1 acyl-CoA thioesterase [Bacteroidia bacterium]
MGRDIGVHGNLFGGRLMSWIDEASAAFACEYCYTPNMVTVRVGELIFKKPLKSGQHVHIYGEISNLGNSSITINIEARRFSLYSGEETLACTTSITFVRIDDDGSPIPIGQTAKKKFQNEKNKGN